MQNNTPVSKGSFLIASPDNEGLVYKRSVVLICEHSEAGSFGLIVNKPLDIEGTESELPLEEVASGELQMRLGGPMQPNQMMLLHSSNTIPDQTLKVLEGLYLGGDIDFLQTSLKGQEPPHILLCLGYSGWLAGQLQQEIAEGDWYIHPAKAENIFQTPPDKLWQILLREMGGKYTSFSMIPEDLDLN